MAATVTRRVCQKTESATGSDVHFTKLSLLHACEFLGAEDVASVMQIYPKDEEFQESCCRALLCIFDTYIYGNSLQYHITAKWLFRIQNQIGSTVKAVIAAMFHFPVNKRIQYDACCMFAKIIHVDPRKSMRCIQSGAITSVLAAMCAFRTDEAMQIMGCEAISAMIQDSAFLDRSRIQESVDILEVCDIVLSAMRVFVDSEQVLMAGSLALSYVLLDSEENDPTGLMNLGVCEVLVAGMHAFPYNRIIQKSACSVFDDLSCSYETIGGLMNSGVITVLVAAMKRFGDCVTIQLCGVHVILMLVQTHDVDLARLVHAGIGEAVFGAMFHFDHNRDICSDVCAIVTAVLLTKRLQPKDMAKFRPRGETVLEAILAAQDTIMANEESDQSESMGEKFDELITALEDQENTLTH